MQMKYVRKDVNDRDVSGDSLPTVAAIAREGVVLQVRFSRAWNPNSGNRVKNDGEKNEGPFNDWQQRQAVNSKDIVLKDRCPTDQAGIC